MQASPCGLGGGPSSGPCSGTYGPSDVGKGMWDASMASAPIHAILAAGAIAALLIFVIWAVGRVAGFWGAPKPALKKAAAEPDADFSSDFLNDKSAGGDQAEGFWASSDISQGGDGYYDSQGRDWLDIAEMENAEEDADEDDSPEDDESTVESVNPDAGFHVPMSDDDYDELENEYFRRKAE